MTTADRGAAPLELTLECEQGDDLFVLPASYAQQRMWFLDRLYPGRPVYNIPSALRLDGALNLEALRLALEQLVARHESLRTVLDLRDGDVVQIVQPAARRELPLVDLSAVDPADRQARVADVLRAEGDRPFDLQAGPLLRSCIVRVNSDEHILLLTVHHAVSDAWSNGVFYRELSALYAAAQAGTEAGLAPLAIQYGDYSIWQRDRLRGAVLDEQLDYWRSRLSGPLPTLQLPTDRPRPAVQTFTGAQEVVLLPPATLEAVKRFAKMERATPFMVLLAAYQLLLHRFSGQSDIIVGCPIAGRTTAETEALIGLFVNTLALRTTLADGVTFREVVAQVRDAALGAFAHADVPFERIVEAIHPARERGHSPIFQVAFQLQNTPAPVLAFPGVRVTRVATPLRVAKFDLTLSLRELNGGLRGAWEYNSDLFDAETVRRMAAHYQVLLNGLLNEPEAAIHALADGSVAITDDTGADPDQSIARIPMLSDAERHRLLVEWNDTARPYPDGDSVHSLFAAQAMATPDATAMTCESATMTYAELDHAAGQLAAQLRQSGVRDGDVVALCAERSVDQIVGLLGILKAGAAYLPLDPAYPRDRLSFMLGDAAARLVVVQSRLVARLPAEPAVPRLLLDGPCRPLADVAPGRPRDAGAPAYVMYTSGSTGQPKGVVVTHRNIVRLVRGNSCASFAPGDRVLGFAPVTFDAATLEIWGPLLNGACLALCPAAVRSVDELSRFIEKAGITTLWLTAALFHEMIDLHVGRLTGVRQLLAGGDVLSPRHVAQALQALPACRVINGYGPTENTTFTCCHAMQGPGAHDPLRPVPIGRPISNTTVYVLDSRQQPVPIGVWGELYTGGDGVALGYLNRVELTAERFLPDPFAPQQPARMYRTGDRVRWRGDGVLEFQGRLDHQVKLRGFRIELEEIESNICRHPGVRSATVVPQDVADGDRRLAAFWVAQAGSVVTPEEIRSHVRAMLPEYMVPAIFVRLDELPVTANGKVDRRALLQFDTASLLVPRASAPARSPLEFELIELWQRMLDVRPIGIRDDFFDLGGHSLLAARLMREIELMTGRALPLSVLFSGATIEHIAAELIASKHVPADGPLVVVRAGNGRRPLFFMHGDVIGGGLYCEAIGRMLHPDQPFLVLPPHGPGGPDTIEAMAEDYLRIVRHQQPQGPYRLGGFCNGGLVAFEMARRLRTEGETVELLFLVDSVGANARFRSLEPLLRLLAARHSSRTARLDARAAAMVRLRKLWALGNRVRRMNASEFGALIGRAARRQAARVARRFDGTGTRVTPARARTVPEGDIPTLDFIGRASRMYIPGTYDGEVHSVWAIGDRLQPVDPTRGWRRVARRVHPYLIPVSHNAVATSHVPELLRECMEQLDREG